MSNFLRHRFVKFDLKLTQFKQLLSTENTIRRCRLSFLFSFAKYSIELRNDWTKLMKIIQCVCACARACVYVCFRPKVVYYAECHFMLVIDYGQGLTTVMMENPGRIFNIHYQRIQLF